jgi:hypothetical protein
MGPWACGECMEGRMHGRCVDYYICDQIQHEIVPHCSIIHPMCPRVGGLNLTFPWLDYIS